MRFRLAAGVILVALSLRAQPTLIDEGRSAISRNDPQAAVTLLRLAIAQSPRSADAHYLLGVAYGKLAERASIFRQPALARHTRDAFERAVQLDPTHLDARFALMQFYNAAPAFLGGSDQKAMRQAEEIRQRDAAAGHRAFAFIYTHQRDFRRASAELEAAVALDAGDMPSWFEIGHLAAISGVNLQRGEQALRRYLGHTPDFDDPPLDRAYFWLGKIYEREGRMAEARRTFAQAVASR